MAKKNKRSGSDINRKLKTVRVLEQSGRVKEAMAYLYLIYCELANQKFGIQKKVSETIRDYAIVMVKEMNQNPQTIYPFIQKIEKAIYGGVSATPEMFKEATDMFGKLHLELTGHNAPGF